MSPPTADRPSARALVLLPAVSAASALLATWQWMELLVVQSGGTATCSFSSTVDCAQVWTSDFAGRVHALTGLPIAALGLEWALCAFALSLWLVHRTVSAGDTRPLEHALKVWAAIGFLSCVTFAVASARLGILCPSCLLTYALTTGFAAAAFVALPGPALPDFTLALKALPRALAIALPLHAALLYPASRTPHGPPALAQGLSEEQVMAYLAQLTPAERKATLDARTAWLAAPVPAYPVPETRQRWGRADAKMRLVEFTDVLCGHCRLLVKMLAQLKTMIPPEQLSIEPRYFPLDGECNPHTGPPKGDGIRCLGAKVQLCLEGRKEYWDVREEIFEQQQSLTPEKILALATAHGLPRAELEACVADPKTQDRLLTDIQWAMAYQLTGTPLVLIDGKEVPPVGPFVFIMALSGGDPDSKYFQRLSQP